MGPLTEAEHQTAGPPAAAMVNGLGKLLPNEMNTLPKVVQARYAD